MESLRIVLGQLVERYARRREGFGGYSWTLIYMSVYDPSKLKQTIFEGAEVHTLGLQKVSFGRKFYRYLLPQGFSRQVFDKTCREFVQSKIEEFFGG